MLRLGIVGAGLMGANHGRVARQIADVEVTHVVDPRLERAEKLSGALGARHGARVDDLLGTVDAAVVAVPTHLHRPVAEQLLQAGKHVLVEKPLAPTSADARALVECARASGCLLQVGHVERFNPAFMDLHRFTDGPVHLDIARISPFSPRVSDGVVLDLMIHDLDLARALTGCSVTSVSALAQHVTTAPGEDLATALLVFENGATATLSASRIGQNKIRTITITQMDETINVDLLRQSVTIQRVDRAEYLGANGMSYRQTGLIEVPFLEHSGEPLALELAAFVAACCGAVPVGALGEDGLAALELAELVSARVIRTGPTAPSAP